MGIALERCAAMGLRNADNTAARLVAEKIIELVERGVIGAAELSSLVKELTGRE